MIIEILYFEDISSVLDLNKIIAPDEILPIIWNNQGRYKIIPVAMIKNKIDLEKSEFLIINWYEAQDLDERTARLLLDQ